MQSNRQFLPHQMPLPALYGKVLAILYIYAGVISFLMLFFSGCWRYLILVAYFIGWGLTNATVLQAQMLKVYKTDRNTNKLLKDGNGQLWVGTSAGLKAFDGNELRDIALDGQKQEVTCLAQNKKRKQLWVGTDKGLFVLDYERLDYRKIASFTRDIPCAIYVHDKKVMVAISDGTVMQVDTQMQTKVHDYRAIFKGHYWVQQSSFIDADQNGILVMAGQNDDLSFLNPETGQVRKAPKAEHSAVGTVFPKNPIIINSGSKAIRFLSSGSYADVTPRVVDSLNNLYGKSGADFFLCGYKLYIYYNESGIYAVNLWNGKVDKVWKEDLAGIPNRSLSHQFLIDKDNVLWLGADRGFAKINIQYPWFERLLYNYLPNSNRVSTRDITMDASGNLYVASYEGLFILDQHKSGAPTNIYRIDNGPLRFVFALWNEPDYLFLTSGGAVFYRFDKKTRQFSDGFYQAAGNNIRGIGTALFKDKNGRMWMGTQHGLTYWDSGYAPVRSTNGTVFDLGDNRVNRIVASAQPDLIWVTTENAGVFGVDIYKGVKYHFSMDTRPALLSNDVNALTEDHKGNLWLGLENGGIAIVDPTRGTCRTITTENSNLCNNTVYGMLWENETRLWVSTQNGLSRFDLSQNYFYNYFEPDGITANEFNMASAYRDSTGKMYFGGVNGVTAFDPAAVSVEPASPRLFVSKITYWKMALGADSLCNWAIQGDKEIVMAPEDRSLLISMGLSDYTLPEKNTYFYRMSGGKDTAWISLGNQPVLRLQAMEAGHHLIELRAVSARGIWSENHIKIPVFIQTAFYKSWWFYGMLLLLITSVIIFFFYLRYHHLHKLNQQRLQIAGDLHDEVGSILTTISIHAGGLENKKLSWEERESKARRIAEVSRSLIGAIRDTLWAIDHKNNHTIEDLLVYMQDYLHEIDRLGERSITFDHSLVNKHVTINYNFIAHFYRIFKEAVNNAIKHSQPSYISIIYQHQPDYFMLSIKNDGSPEGVPENMKGQGLRNMQLRASKIHAEFRLSRYADIYVVVVESQRKSS